MTRRQLFLTATLLVLLGCETSKDRPGGRTTGILAGTTRVEVFRIDGGDEAHEPRPINPGDLTVSGYAILAKGADQGPECAQRLEEILSVETMLAGMRAHCFWPGVAFRIWKGQEYTDMIICFRCQNYYLGPATDGRAMENGWFAGSPSASRLVRLAKEAFPDDKEIQALEEK